MFLPKEVDGGAVMFGPQRIEDYLPSMKDIPERFHDHYDPFCEIVSNLFFSGGSVANWKTKEGIDKNKAIRHFMSVMKSWEPKHEHKTAGCAYMLHEWFEHESLGIKE